MRDLQAARLFACLVLCFGAGAGRAACHRDADCNYNGVCMVDAGACVCDAAWGGPACDALALLPPASKAAPPLGYRRRDRNGSLTTSWGGSVLHDAETGTWHMYAAEITGHCGMNVWLSNSRVVHAVSPDPRTTPFAFASVVAPVFAHEPIVARAPTGEVVLFYTAVLPPGKLPVNGGQRCRGCSDGNSVAACGTDANRNASINLPTYMIYSDGPDGPWSEPQMIPGTDVFADQNFAPLIQSDGSLVALARQHVYKATHWKDVATYSVTGTWDDAGEDPMIWNTRTGDGRTVLHNIVHVNRVNTHGLHYYSADHGDTWIAAQGYAYTSKLAFADGSSINYGCRERPHVVLNATGTIVGLTNGAAEQTCHSDAEPVVDYSYTLFQAVKQPS